MILWTLRLTQIILYAFIKAVSCSFFPGLKVRITLDEWATDVDSYLETSVA